ncbi:MAG: D-alanyl-D-alanine carboxypeptidase [Clostridium sp.]|nr:D-alanyl-D-alanine carboxypeptidase [Acetatifactor muris]MCM1528102.1 D-alanyl-D-alanine carboxypeptidase [Bacteroides sp.]MCM1562115.1 D-alanyl-D-alanine carboxypeptidase [Clostridium sp.]
MSKYRRSAAVRLMGGFFCVCFWILAMRETTVTARAEEPDLSLYATAAVLMDADSGRVLYEREGYTPMAMASTTKIMTCILVLEQGELDDMAQVSAYAASMPKVKLYAARGEEYQVRNLLFSLMLESHNDSAVVLAEYIGKRYLPPELAEKSTADYTAEESKQAVKAFANLMNAKAKELGCTDTWFITPNGLDATETFEGPNGEAIQKEHCTTAADLARIMAYCVKESPGRDLFREITRTESYSFYVSGVNGANGRTVTCTNHNAFLNMMDGAFSGKTGFTNKAGYCYVGALERGGRTYVVALLACGWPNNKTYKWSDTRTLMEYGLANFDFREIPDEGTAYDEGGLQPLPVEDGRTAVLGDTARVELMIRERHDGSQSARDPVRLLMKSDEKISVECEMEQKLQAPVAAGTPVGSITYSVDGKVYLTETIVTKDGVDRVELRWCVRQVFERFLMR